MDSNLILIRKIVLKRILVSFLILSCLAMVFAGCGAVASYRIATATPVITATTPKESYADVVEKVSPAVVRITVERGTQNAKRTPFDNDYGSQENKRTNPNGQDKGTALGSGVIIAQNGLLLTNYHVVEGATNIRIELTDKRAFTAKIVGTDQPSDLAVLKIEGENFPFAVFGNSDAMRVGDVVLAIGNPLGLQQTVTAGIISAKARATGLGDGSFEDFIQTDAPINQGNSGGALINTRGEVIGINSQILSPSGGNIGIGFAIPSNMVKNIMDQIVKNGKVNRGFLGLSIQNITAEMAKTLGLTEVRGVLVQAIQSDSPAAKAGLKQGDIILAINGERVDDGNCLRNKIANTQPGTEISLTIKRGSSSSEQTIKATLSEWTGNNERKEQNETNGNGLGFSIKPLTPELARQMNLPRTARGLVVTSVQSQSLAETSGLQEGDVIITVNRQPVMTEEDLQFLIEQTGERALTLLIYRDGQTGYVTIRKR